MKKLKNKFHKLKPLLGLASIYLKSLFFHKIDIYKKRKSERKKREYLTKVHKSSRINNNNNDEDDEQVQNDETSYSDYIESFYDVNETFYEIISDCNNQEHGLISNKNNNNTLERMNFETVSLYSSVIEASSICSNKTNSNNESIQVEFELEDFKEDPIDMSKQRNVITHVISNLKVGMDLDNIPLPAFILESRSMLEMFADFAEFTELILEMPDANTQHERMIRVLKWYLSTFRARVVVKKPYNPIQGEVFRCVYDTKSKESETIIESNIEGTLPWSNSNQLSFIAEQVSHHPPISAFYLEHISKGIELSGFCRIKSKYLGLSVGVESIGNGVINLLKHNEQYLFTFPTAFVRSILTIPWLEMGGKVTISCEKTGYSAQINFLTKPFYGGKKHQIEGNIYSPDKKILNTITGDWTETIYIQTGNEHKKQVFIESSGLNKYKKQVRKVNDQEENESRKVWQEVTYFLRNKQCELANKAKYQVEQKQREQAKLRKENNIENKTKYFHLKDNQWVFNKPLMERIINSNENKNT